MTDQPTPDDFNDELLSAYLDDELSRQERARVEERLAADPAARQMVEQLRTVSRAVQELPQESVGEDLRGAVLQRAERAMLAPATTPARAQRRHPDGDATRPPGSLPRLTIGRSARGWIWASLAVAAALLIMFVQPGGERDENLPDVAVARRAEDAAGRRARDNLELHAAPAPPASAPVPAETTTGDFVASADSARTPALAGTSGPAEPASESPAAANRRLARTEDSPRNQPGSEREVLADRLSRAAPGRAGGRAAALDESSFLDRTSSESAAIDENEVVVVRVNVRPAALRGQAFDKLLVSNGIVLQPPPAEEEQPGVGGEQSAGVPVSALSGVDQPVAGPQDVDAVLVEAPPAQIERCLADLKADEENYLGVTIDDTSVDEKTPAKKLVSELNWKRYSRGQVPRQQKVELAPGANAFYEFRGGQFGSGGAAAGSAAEVKEGTLGQNLDATAAKGRAIRMQSQQLDGRQVIEQIRGRELTADQRAEEDSLKLGAMRRAVEAQRDKAANTLQVLFVLSAEPTSSPAAGDRVP